MRAKGTRLAIVVLLLALLSACSSPPSTGAGRGSTPSPPPADETPLTPDDSKEETSASETEALPLRFSKRKAMVHVRKLAGKIGVRVKASSNERTGARYIRKTFERFGYSTHVQRFSTTGGTSRNVVAWWPGAKRYPFVVGGHMDSVPGSPGANDNASGTATVLELARIFAGTPQANFIRFVAFGAEEYDSQHVSHHDGSYHYVNRLGDQGRARLGGMLSVDMVADGRPLLVGHSNIARNDIVARTIYNKMRKAGIGVSFITLCDCSDHGPFEHAGIPAAFAYSGRESDYHSPSDTVPNMKPNDLLRTGKAVRAFLKHLDKAMLDRFRRS